MVKTNICGECEEKEALYLIENREGIIGVCEDCLRVKDVVLELI